MFSSLDSADVFVHHDFSLALPFVFALSWICGRWVSLPYEGSLSLELSFLGYPRLNLGSTIRNEFFKELSRRPASYPLHTSEINAVLFFLPF